MKTVAIIGCGKPPTSFAGHKVGWAIGYAHASGYLEAFPGAELSAVDPNTANLQAFAETFGIPPERRYPSTEALYAAGTPDAVSICTWPELHCPQGLAAMRAGVRAVTIEKPIALDGWGIQQLLDESAARKTRVAVAHQRRYEPPYVRARELIRQGVLGQNVVIEARVGDDWDVLSWTTHWFDMATYFFDAVPTSVLAGVDHTGQRRYGHAVEDASVVFADYGPGRQAVFITGPAALPEFGVTVRGERGMMHVGNPIKLWTTNGYREEPVGGMNFHSAYAELFRELWTAPDGVPSRCDLKSCAPATLMAYAAHQSAVTQRRVTLPLTTWYPPLEVEQHAPTPEPGEALRIVLLADGHHEWLGLAMAGRLGLADALRWLGHEVTLLDAAGDLAPDALGAADVLVLYHTQQRTQPSHRAVVEPWFAAGRPVVVSHCGIGAYADWPEFRQWIGGYWVWGGESQSPSRHPHVTATLRVNDPGRFNVPWRDAWLPNDEVYQQLGSAGEIRPLVTAIAPDGAEQVFAWQVKAHPNVVAWLPGHRRDMFSLPVVRDGLRAALELACGSQKSG